MDNERHNLTCPKCGSEIEVSEGQTIGHCSFCDSLIPLPQFMINPSLVDKTTYHNMINRINKANDFTLSYQFHRAFNLFDKLIKNNYNLGINDYFPYFGKALAQYGVCYIMNDKLENELICLKLVRGSIFQNENYQKALEYADTNTEAILKQIAGTIDTFQKDLQKALITSKPVDVCILVDSSPKNLESKIDAALGTRIKDKLAKLNYTANVTSGLMEHINKDFVIELFKNLTLANHLVVVSINSQHLNNPLFRHIWMSYYSDEELAETITNRMSIITDDDSIKESLPIANINFYKSTALDEHFNNLTSCLKTIKLYEDECTKATPTYPEIRELLNEKRFDEVKSILNDKLLEEPLNYVEWWMMYLAKHSASNNEELLDKVIDPVESYYFQKAYLTAPRFVKRNLYDYYLKAREALDDLAIVDEEYDVEVEKYQKQLYKKEKAKLVFSTIPVILVTILDFLTISLANIWSFLIMLVLNVAAYFVLGKQVFSVLAIGKIPDAAKSDSEKKNYIQQIKKALKPHQAARFLPNAKTKRMHTFTFVVLAICAFATFSFFVKEAYVGFKNSNLNYYYVFNNVVVTGGRGESVVIPKTIDKRKVIKIGNNAFENNQTIKKVVINNGIKELGSSCFKNCINLEEATVPSTINKVDSANAPFEGCNNLKQFLYQGTDFSPSDLLGADYQEKMFNINLNK